MGHENYLINDYIDITARIERVRKLLQTRVTAYPDPMDLAVAVLNLLDGEQE
jgi:hypothetical protein